MTPVEPTEQDVEKVLDIKPLLNGGALVPDGEFDSAGDDTTDSSEAMMCVDVKPRIAANGTVVDATSKDFLF